MIDFDAIMQRKEDRKNQAIKFNKKKQQYFDFYKERFLVRGYDQRNPHLFEKITQFCAYYYAGINSKGLFLCKADGDKDPNTGIGKTWGVEIIGELFDVKVITAQKLSEYYTEHTDRMKEVLSQPNCFKSKKRNDLIIDEVGAELLCNKFGQKSESFVDVLEHRYLDFIQKGSFTHFTSNLTHEEIKVRYAHRVWSRINEMCNIIEVSGADNRFN